MKQMAMESVQAGMNHTALAGFPSDVAIWVSIAAITGIGQKDSP